ncbi:hypothetical protein Patl1_10507 [Pistacia atlantica]|uniref:Uncharacterized protein n=1 Tax=Pistacia atlantica TaxID=434234 RepID=A0ACC1A6T0_9ROSI|nr:hypothetical protein Patl1_10507 [Pistacia atlantica]
MGSGPCGDVHSEAAGHSYTSFEKLLKESSTRVVFELFKFHNIVIHSNVASFEVEDFLQVVSSQDELFHPTPPIAPSITLSHSEDVTLPTTDFTSTKVKRGHTRGKGLSKMNKAFGKKLKVHVDLDEGRLVSQLGVFSYECIPIPIKWKDMEVHDFKLALDNLDLHVEIEDIGDEAIQEKIEQLLMNQLRNALHKLDNHFKKFTTLEEAQRNKPKENSLTQGNWNLLCKYWYDPNVKV